MSLCLCVHKKPQLETHPLSNAKSYRLFALTLRLKKIREDIHSENSQTKIWNFAHLIVSLQPNGDVPVFGEGHKRESGASPEQYPLL